VFAVAVVLMLIALFLLFITAPSPTVLSVQVVDAETGDPLPAVAVRINPPSGAPVPTLTTDPEGVARFEDLQPDPAYLIRVQKADYELTFEPGVAVPEGKETEVTVPIYPSPGGRFFVGLDGARVAEVDTASFLITRTWRLPALGQGATRHLYLHPTEDRLYAVVGSQVCILDTQTGDLQECLEVDSFVESLSAEGSRLLLITGLEGSYGASKTGESVVVVGNPTPGNLLTLDASTGALLASEKVYSSTRLPRLIWRPDGEEVFIAEPSDGSLWLLDIDPREVLLHTPTGAFPKEGFRSTDGHYRYTWSTASFENQRTAFRTKLTPAFQSQTPLVNLGGFSLSSTGQELYVLDPQLGTLSILDPAGENLPILVAVGKRPVALVVSSDDRWAYVANRDSHTISVIYLPSASVVHTILLEGEPLSLTLR
jgi:hypothetical protein